ncbi:aspartate/glutamate racemase family protein [Xanthobacter autotrophicus]|uniref:aspartate/glutamate racemase family protein n=1 Tax=Xanthobacter TaxID=279 RepID=UPI0024AAAD95|nr:aspartate/glutamate racemase family protein [Xanthobacter autotrophicus]MDI4664298.1 aspartate/glutamate racemase family protein [Xanthobacter autotrophicus]
MKILVLNGNTSAQVTERMISSLRPRCPESVQLVGATAPFGMPYVSTRAAVAVAGHAVQEAVRAAVEGEATAGRGPFDACLYACFGEPGIEALRETHAFPVAGMAEASILTALQLGARFSIVTLGAAWPAMLRDLMRRAGFEARCAGFGVVPGDALAVATRREHGLRVVREAVDEVIARQGPDVVIVGGAALAGYGTALAAQAPVPVLDSLVVSFEQALALARLGPLRSGPIRPDRVPQD